MIKKVENQKRAKPNVIFFNEPNYPFKFDFFPNFAEYRRETDRFIVVWIRFIY